MATITGKQITKVYLGDKQIFSTGSAVNYVVDSNIHTVEF